MGVLTELNDYILTMAEGMAPGEKLPGARQIAERFSCSLPRVQAVLDALEQCGVVVSRPRSGTFVREGFRDRVLPRNTACAKFLNVLSETQKKRFRRSFPDMHLSGVFHTGGVEILSSFTILARQGNYEDLSGIFAETFPDAEKRFYLDSCLPFRTEGRLCAVPLIFSPQLLWYDPELFRRAGAPLPESTWGEAEFYAALRTLHRTLSGRRIINYSPGFAPWIGFVIAAGGGLFDGSLPDPVLIDSPPTVKACLKYVSLLRELDLVEDFCPDPEAAFAQGNLAMFVGFRQSSCAFREHGMDFVPGAVRMPDLGGRNSHQAAAGIAFRRGIFSKEEMKAQLKFWLSAPLQEELGRNGYGIPFLRSVALKTRDVESPADRALFGRISPPGPDYYICSEELGSLITRSASFINTQPPGEIPRRLGQLAATVRYITELKRQQPRKGLKK